MFNNDCGWLEGLLVMLELGGCGGMYLCRRRWDGHDDWQLMLAGPVGRTQVEDGLGGGQVLQVPVLQQRGDGGGGGGGGDGERPCVVVLERVF